MRSRTVILDHLGKLELPSEQSDAYHNELQTLNYLANGLNFLYLNTCKFEREFSHWLEAKDGGKRKTLFAHLVTAPGIPQDLISCFFHWYAVSCCNYTWLVGWIGRDSRILSVEPDNYARQVIPEILTWRHKVAAHFAKIKPSKKDSTATRDASVLYPVGFSEGRFEASPFEIEYTKNDTITSSSQIPSWKLTEIHEGLAKRYWPSALEKAEEVLQNSAHE